LRSPNSPDLGNSAHACAGWSGALGHVALGRSYSEMGGTNLSALHWDLICDLRQGGRLTSDGQVIQEDGHFR
jgi:aminopeptidase